MANFTHYKGDTWRGLTVTVTTSGIPLDITGAEIIMQLRKAPGSPVVLERSTDGLSITLTEPTVGKFTINKMIIDLTTGVYRYDVQMTLAGDKTTLLKGTFEITCDIAN
jgi:hypothetical protein